MRTFVFVVTIFLFISQELFATELVGSFKDWNLFKTKVNESNVCYLVSIPIKKSSNFVKRGEPYIVITNFTNDADEVVASSGFNYRKNSDVEISFGTKKFYFFPHLTLSWANDRNEDLDFIKEMQKNEELTVSATSYDNKFVSDNYSLIGFSRAYKKMKEICKEI